MNAKKMQELLSDFNPKKIVKLHYMGGEPVVAIQEDKRKNIVIIKGANDKSSEVKNLTIDEFLKLLDYVNPEAEVRLHTKNGEVALFVVTYLNVENLNEVWIEAESDNDMSSEIEARFENALEEGIDELDVYMDMLEIGIDVEMVRRWMDDDIADHMREFCEEHGLI